MSGSREISSAERLRPRPIAGERLWWSIAAAALALPLLATLMLALTGATTAALGGAQVCPLQVIAGLPCPLCGGTSSWVAIWQGHLPEAIAHNPFAALLFPANVLLLGFTLGAALAAFDPKPILTRVRWVSAGVGVAATMLLSWAWMLARH